MRALVGFDRLWQPANRKLIILDHLVFERSSLVLFTKNPQRSFRRAPAVDDTSSLLPSFDCLFDPLA